MKTQFPTIETKRLLLRQFTPNDIEKVYEGLSHPDVIRYYGISFESLEATKEQMDWFKNLEEKQTGIWWAICNKDNSTFMGAGGLNDLDKSNRKAEVGFWLLPDFWKKGIMQEAMPHICQYGFNELELHRIEGFVDSNNKQCKNAMAKLDFTHEGTMVDCEAKGAQYVSLDIYAKINPY